MDGASASMSLVMRKSKRPQRILKAVFPMMRNFQILIKTKINNRNKCPILGTLLSSFGIYDRISCH